MDANFMGQEILNPPTVEGWHTGREWIDTGTLVERINSAALEIGDVQQPGVRAIINRLRARGVLSPPQLVNACLELVGPLQVSSTTQNHLVSHAAQWGDLRFDLAEEIACSERRIAELLQLIVATREYQMA
jgi:hypothetical protein